MAGGCSHFQMKAGSKWGRRQEPLSKSLRVRKNISSPPGGSVIPISWWMSRCRRVCACRSRESRRSTGLPVPPEKCRLAAVNSEPSHLSMAAVGSLRREEGE